MKEFLEDSAMCFYMDLISVFCGLLASIIGFIKRKKHIGLQYMFLYPFASALQMTGFYFDRYILKSDSFLFSTISVWIFLLIEILCFYFYYSTMIRNIHLLKWIKMLPIIYLSILFFELRNHGFEFILQNPLYRTQSLVVLALVVTYLFYLLNTIPKNNLLDEPAFWVSLGALLYFLCTIPIYAADKYIFKDNGLLNDVTLFSLNYICYSLLFLLLTRAYLCKATVKP